MFFKNHILNLTANIYKTLGFTANSNDTRLDVYSRALILNYVCKYGDKECIEWAKNEFAKFETTNTK